MRIANKKYILLGVIMFSFSIAFIGMMKAEIIIGRIVVGIFSLIFLIATVDYVLNPDIKANESGIKFYHKKINWNEIKYIDNYPHECFEDDFEEWLYEDQNVDISKIDEQKINEYREEFIRGTKGVYIGLGNEVLRLDVYLNLNDGKKTEIINKLNSMLALYKLD